MSGFYTVAVTVCAAAIACAILSTFVSDGGLKRILSLVMGAFMVCSLIVPAKNAVQKLGLNLSSYPSSQQLTATADEAVNRQVVAQAKEKLDAAQLEFLTKKTLGDRLLFYKFLDKYTHTCYYKEG